MSTGWLWRKMVYRKTVCLAVAFVCVVTLRLCTIPTLNNTGVALEGLLQKEYPLNSTAGYWCRVYNDSYGNRSPADLRVIILTYNRPLSLLRLLISLNRAHYHSQTVTIDIWIDRSKTGLLDEDTVTKAKMFRFLHGHCNIHVQPRHAGITGQWLETWDPPRHTPEVAVIMEDDLTVSPHFYSYLLAVTRKYGNRPDVAGFTLQGSTIKHSMRVSKSSRCCVEMDYKHKVYLYPTPGTSGFAPNRLQWIAFKDWLKEIQENNTTVPLVPNHISSEWYLQFERTGKTDSMWEMEYLYYIWRHKQFTLYPNFSGNRGLVYNWNENGLHYSGQAVRDQKQADTRLVLEWTPEHERLPDNPVRVDNAGEIIL